MNRRSERYIGMNKNLKVAIVHDYIKEYGGAERVLERLIKIFPNADIYTSMYAPEYLGPHRKRFEQYDIRTTWINKIPKRHKIISPLRLLSPLAFKSLDLKLYDIVIVSQTGAYFPNFLHKSRKQKIICYTHTPPRYLYGYKTARDIPQNPFIKLASNAAFNALRIVDFEASKKVDIFIANSQEVKKRIEKFYRRDAIVIYPPVAVPSVVRGKKEDFYLAGGRLARAKGMDIIVKAFVDNKKPLKIFGKGFAGYEEVLKKLAKEKSNIEFVGEVDDELKFELMGQSKAFIFASYDEDFGITPVESMGLGTPVIAYRSGGVKETVVDGKTGIFFDSNTPESLNEAIQLFESTKINPDICVQRADEFSERVFDRKLKEVVNA